MQVYLVTANGSELRSASAERSFSYPLYASNNQFGEGVIDNLWVERPEDQILTHGIRVLASTAGGAIR